jgi:predicted dehydrogenase
MAQQTLRVGIVGGNAERAWAHDAHVPALRALPRFTLAAVSARTQDLADQAAAAFGAPRAFGNSLELVRDPGVDVVAVTVKVPEHRAIVLAALAAGKHVYCEWPLGRDAAEAEEMAAAARGAKGHCIIGLQALSAPAVRHAAAAVAAGRIGTPRMLRVLSPTAGWGPVAPAFYAYLQDRRNGATMMTISGGHTIAAMEALAGPYAELDARCSIFQKQVRIAGTADHVERTCADHAVILGRHASGCVSSLEVIGGQANMAFRMELTGSLGTLTITARKAVPGGYQVNTLECSATVDLGAPPPPVTSLEGPPANVAETWMRLAADIDAGRRTVPDFDVALRLTRALDAIDRASDTGSRQRL